MRIPVLMFDFGNVVGFFDYSIVFHRFGLKLGLPAQQFESMMHERGAARLSSEFESGRLTAEEWQLVKQHPRAGVEMLGRSPAPLVKAVVVQHHEKWDGSGYPDGLKREDIPLAGRIVAVAHLSSLISRLQHRPQPLARMRTLHRHNLLRRPRSHHQPTA